MAHETLPADAEPLLWVTWIMPGLGNYAVPEGRPATFYVSEDPSDYQFWGPSRTFFQTVRHDDAGDTTDLGFQARLLGTKPFPERSAELLADYGAVSTNLVTAAFVMIRRTNDLTTLWRGVGRADPHAPGDLGMKTSVEWSVYENTGATGVTIPATTQVRMSGVGEWDVFTQLSLRLDYGPY